MRHHDKFRQNRLNGYGDIAFNGFQNGSRLWILKIQIFLRRAWPITRRATGSIQFSSVRRLRTRLSLCVTIVCDMWYARSYNWTSSPISGTTWTHTYAAEGTYSVNVTCYNNVSIQSLVVPQYIQAPIVNLRLRHNGALVVNTLLLSFVVVSLLTRSSANAQEQRQHAVSVENLSNTGKLYEKYHLKNP